MNLINLLTELQKNLTELQKKIQILDEIITKTPNDTELGEKFRKEW